MSRIIPQSMTIGKVSTLNSSTATLGTGASFTGSWERILNYGIIFINVYSDQASATDGLIIEQSSDGVNADHSDVFSVPAGTGKNFSINPYALYLRVRYTNGASAQGSFRLQTILKWNSKPSSHRIQDEISNDDDAELVKAIITGETPTGSFFNFQATRKGNFKVSVEEYGDTPSIDAFARLRISQPHTIFDCKQPHDDQPLFFDESLGGSATSTHSSTHASTTLAVTASASDFAIRQTKQRFNYQPGKSQLVYFTFRAPQQTGATLRMGLFDGTGTNNLTANNGVFLSVTASDISWNIAKDGSTTESVSQASWNVSPLDGTGVSGIDLDMDTTQIGVIDYEWLGVGRVRVGFVIGGIIRYCHYFYHANISTHVYMSTPNLPVRYDITTDGSATAELEHICCSVISEGGAEQTGILRSVDMGTTHIDANTAGTTYAMIGIRLKSAYYDITVAPEYFSIISLTNDDFRWSLQLNPTVNGTFTYSDITNSSIQRALGATGNDITAEGLVIDSGYSKSSTGTDRKFITALRIGSTIGGTLDELVLCVTPVSSNADYLGSLTIRELI